MASSTLTPNAAGTYTQWPSRYNCASNYICCQTNDADTSYIYGPRNVSKTDTYNMSNLPAAAATVSSFANYARCRRSGVNDNNAFGCYDRWSGNNRGPASMITVSDGYQTDGDSHTTMADGSTPPSVARINAMECGVTCNNVGGGNQIRCTYVYASVTWDYGGGGSAFLLVEVLLPVLGAIHGLNLGMMPRLADLAYRYEAPKGTRTLIEPHEYEWLCEEWQAYTHPRYYDLGGLAWAAA